MMKRILLAAFVALLLCPAAAQAQITFVGSAEGSSSPNADATLTLPAMSQNDLVIVCAAIGDNDNAAVPIDMVTAGYTAVSFAGGDLFANDTQEVSMHCHYKFMGASPDATAVVNGAGGTDAALAAVAMVFRGVNLTTPFDTTNASDDGINTMHPNPPSLNHGNPAGVWTVIAGASGHTLGGAGTYTFPTGYTTNAIDRGHDDTSDVTIGMGYKTSPADPEDPAAMTHSGADSANFAWAAVTMALRPAVMDPTQIHYRFYDDDGDEDSSTPLEAEDTSTPITVATGSTTIAHFRITIQEDDGVSGAATDDWQLQYDKNFGGYTNVTTSSANVRAVDSAHLTDGAATTNRATNGLTDGTGSFVAGEQSEDGLIDDFQLTANNYTELLYAIEFVGNDLDDGDIVHFRVLYKGALMVTFNLMEADITVVAGPSRPDALRGALPVVGIGVK